MKCALPGGDDGYAELFQKALGQKQEETLRRPGSDCQNCKRLNTTLISLHTLAELQAVD